jgi:hypothetical protein
MAAKKKTKKKQTKSTSRKAAGRKVTPAKKLAKKKPAKKIAIKKKSTKRKPVSRKPAPKTKKTVGKKTSPRKNTIIARAIFVPEGQGSRTVGRVEFAGDNSRARSGGQSGDLQGLSNAGGADSESVDELLEEGNAFEADVVTGVEDAGNADEKEVRTHEVSEDDVPGEYLDDKE